MSDHYFSCDWGTSHFRLRLVRRRPVAVVSEYRSEEGVAKLATAAPSTTRAERFHAALLQGIEQLPDLPVDVNALPAVISGMAGSSIGWREVAYRRLPFSLDGGDLGWQDVSPRNTSGAPIYLLAGVRSDRDVMRGEETEAVGLASLPGMADLLREAVVVLPGTHSKHLHVVRNRIADFHTSMTGELFDLLRRHSSLRHSTGPLPEGTEPAAGPFDPLAEPFREGVVEGANTALPAALFQVRARQLLRSCEAASNTAFLSGLLIGAELAPLERQTESLPIILAAGPRLAGPYRAALDLLGLSDRVKSIPPDRVDGLSVLGHAALLDRLE